VSRKKALVGWSSGKDSAWALHEVRQAGELEVVSALTTVTETFDRVSMHGVRRDLLRRQLDAVGLPCIEVVLPFPCSNERYGELMTEALERAEADSVEVVVFGDLFLEDVRAYRERQLATVGLEAAFPLWGRETGALAREMIDGGLEARISCVDSRLLDPSFAGRRYDHSLLADLPQGVDPCGENGEMHSFVTAGPMMDGSIDVRVGEIVDREGFIYADIEELTPR